MNIQLLIIDGQNSFCSPGDPSIPWSDNPFDNYELGLKYPAHMRRGELYVPGAEEDMKRLSDMVKKHGSKIDHIRFTLDSHHLLHIAHPICWVDENGNHPSPFTTITYADVSGADPKWKAFNPGWQNRQVEYIRKLEEGQRYALTVWFPHCLIGSYGHGVYPELFETLLSWEKDTFNIVDFVTKGSNIFTEHYSVVKADVPDPADPSTNINTGFIKRLEEADRILVAGEAGSHCVRFSVTDIINEFGQENAKKFVILEDAMNAVPGFESLQEDFFNEMKNLGIQITKTTEFFG